MCCLLWRPAVAVCGGQHEVHEMRQRHLGYVVPSAGYQNCAEIWDLKHLAGASYCLRICVEACFFGFDLLSRFGMHVIRRISTFIQCSPTTQRDLSLIHISEPTR